MDAVDDLGDAIDATRELLLPVDVGLWIKLAIVVFFVGGLATGGGAPAGDVGMYTEDPTAQPVVEEIPDEVIELAAVLVVIAVLLWLAFSLVGAIMEFVFIESLRSQSVHVRRYAGENLGRGLRLFGFRLLVGLLPLAVVGAPAAYVVLDAPTLEDAIGSLIPLFVLGIVLYLGYALVMRFTSEFVAPIMLLEERGVLGAWKRFWPTLTGNIVEFAVYLVLVWILQLVISFAAGIVIAFGAVVIAIPFLILAALFFVLGEIGFVFAVLVGIVGVLAIVLFVALVQMPIRTYFQYYALLLLGDTNRELDLVPELRESIRADEDVYDRRGGDAARPDDRWGGDDRDDRDRWSDESDPWDDSDLWSDDSSDWDAPDDRNRDEDDRDDRDRGW